MACSVTAGAGVSGLPSGPEQEDPELAAALAASLANTLASGQQDSADTSQPGPSAQREEEKLRPAQGWDDEDADMSAAIAASLADSNGQGSSQEAAETQPPPSIGPEPRAGPGEG